VALARQPPADGAALADVPGVGSALAERWGRAILDALHGPRSIAGGASARAARQESGKGQRTGSDDDVTQGGPRRRALERWREGVAVELGVARYVVLRDSVVATLATCDVRDSRALAAIRGLGPRTLAKHSQALLRLIAAHPPDRSVLPMDSGDAGLAQDHLVSGAGP
jgi:hypothetical protein